MQRSWKVILGSAVVASAAFSVRGRADQAPAPSQDLAAVAEDAYIYGYPLLVMDATARQMTNVPTPSAASAPVNQLARVDTLPDASFKAVVRPNVDTLYTVAFLDVAKEPMVLHIPDTGGRYYLMPMLDAYTNVVASPGKRTTGTQEQTLAIVGPDWQGTLPDRVTKVQAPTNLVWLIGRTQINGKADLPAVTALTAKYTLTPLSAYGKPYTPPRTDHVDPSIDMTAKPPDVVAKMDPNAYFTRLAQLMKDQPPPARDQVALARFAKLGLSPGRFQPSPEAQRAISAAPRRALARIQANVAKLGTPHDGWMFSTSLGSYDTRYLERAAVALAGLGANLAKDAVYPSAYTDAKGQPLTGENRYVLHFAKGQEPPVNAFWSLTMYDANGYLVANPIDRFAIGDRDKLKRNPDGSLDLLIQHDPPTGDLAANWLPAPAGPFNLTLRLYWPKDPVLEGRWTPPGTERSGGAQVGQAGPRR